MRFSQSLSATCLLVLVATGTLAGTARADDAPIDFVRDIQPIFAKHCAECHGAARQEGGLRLTVRASALVGGDSGERAIVPFDPKASKLLQAIDGSNPDFKMPPEGEGEALSAEQVERVRRWILAGAVWPAEADALPQRPSHWAWNKPYRPATPVVKDATWPRHPLDAFVLAQLEQAGLKPAPEADRYTLARRVYLDLIGLPPAAEQVAAFVNDAAPGAYERMVDRALADPAYGERWARMWLDLARYADSKGYGSDPLRTMWRYRDWVIEAFNKNQPFDEFTRDQIAGDLLPSPTPEQLLATAFHRNTMANDEGGTDDEEFRVAAVKDRIETTMQVWMGLTMGCAKCHSHKFDPITQREYYQAYALFNQTEDADRGDEEPKLPSPTVIQTQQQADRRARLAALQTQLATPPTTLANELPAWEQAQRAQAEQWKVLELTPVPAAAGEETPTFERQPDGSWHAAAADKATIRLEANVSQPGITAFRLEALTDDALPQHGPGWAGGNFVLNEFSVQAKPQAAEPPKGRFVRIELPGENKLISLAEVEVFAGNENLARAGKATQSSTAFNAPAELAIDGQTEGDFDKRSVTHTGDENNPWWEVDLGSVKAFDRIVLWNRTDHGLESRLQNFKVIVLADDRQAVWQRTVTEAPRPSSSFAIDAVTQIDLNAASADVAQQGFPAEAAIDGKAGAESGWAIAPHVGKSHELIVNTATPLPTSGPTTLRFTLVQSHGGGHTLGRFRLSAATSSGSIRALPQPIAETIATAPAVRTPAQQAELLAHYWAESPASASLRTEIAAVQKEIEANEKEIVAIPIMRELVGEKRRTTHTMVKGNFLAPGEVVEPALPTAFHPLPAGEPMNRLGLARWLVDEQNPLSARVMVNRLWAQLFGVGLVPTEEDFGTQGLPPTHPEVLDALAIEFGENGWDIKNLLRQIVTSATYRQASTPVGDALEKDPNNRLLAHGPRFRLEAEMVRDQALAISGLLSRKQGGPSVFPPQPDGLWRAAFNGQRTWATSTGEDRYRRGLYTTWRRTVPYPSMATFDAPSREICTLRRVSTNTPLQAFVTMNDPVYVEASQALARRIVAEGGATPQERSAFVLQLALARPAQADQVAELTALYQDELAHYKDNAADAVEMATLPLGPLAAGQDPAELAAWTVVSNVVLNLDGVLTKR